MSDIKFKSRMHGLRLAHQHRSAESQASTSKVYEKLSIARMGSNDLPDSVRISRGVKALRVGIDRIARLGERLRENKNVAPADHKLMNEEVGYLKEQLQKVFEREMGQSVAFNQSDQFNLHEAPDQFLRVVEAVFSGKVKLLDRVDRVGQLIDLEGDHFLLNFKGDFYRKDGPRSVDVVTGVESLSSALRTRDDREPIAINGEFSGQDFINEAVRKVAGDIMASPRRASRAQIEATRMPNISILFDDALGNKIPK